MRSPPPWGGRADAWFKLLGAIVFGYLILDQVVALVRHFAAAAIILVGGILLAYLVLPAVGLLRRRCPLPVAIAIVYVAGAGVLAAIAYLIVPLVSAQFASLVQNMPAMQRAVERFVSDPHSPVIDKLPAFVQTWLQKLPGQVAAQFERNAVTYSSSLVDALGTLTALGALAVAIPVASIYLMAEAHLLHRFAFRRIPPRWRRPAASLVSDVDAVLGGFVRGQLTVACVVGVLATIALLILREPYALLIGAWAGLADVVPYVGPFAGALPAGIVAIIYQGWGNVIWVVVAFVAINQLEGQLLAPRIVSRSVRVTPLGVIFALIISAQLFGFVGLIVAVPLAGLVRIAIVRFFPERRSERAPGVSKRRPRGKRQA